MARGLNLGGQQVLDVATPLVVRGHACAATDQGLLNKQPSLI